MVPIDGFFCLKKGCVKITKSFYGLNAHDISQYCVVMSKKDTLNRLLFNISEQKESKQARSLFYVQCPLYGQGPYIRLRLLKKFLKNLICNIKFVNHVRVNILKF